MSGTSLDGVDVALIETDGERVARFGPTGCRPYSDEERALLRQALAEGVALTDRWSRPGILAEADAFVTRVHAEVVEAFLETEGIDRADVAVVGFHGQTVLHRPEARLTVQIGEGAALAQRLGIAVAHDFRAADIAAGGQGAPLVPVFHQALARDLDRPHPIACDTGPGNALIDDFMRSRTGEPYDNYGDVAATGIPDRAFIDRVLADKFFGLKPPKSLDRDSFGFAKIGLPDYSVPDGAATLSALTVQAVASIVANLPEAPKAWIVGGGGARNRKLMKMLKEKLISATVETADEAGWSADALEAQAFAFLAVRTLQGLPISFPRTTGAPAPMPGGVVARPN